MRLQRQRQRAVVVDHMLARRHGRQRHARLALQAARRSSARCPARLGEERQPFRGAAGRSSARTSHSAARRSSPTERNASASASRSSAAARDAGAPPQIAHAGKGPLPRRDQHRGLRLAKPLDLAEAEPHRMRASGYRGRLRGMARRESCPFPPPLRGRAREGGRSRCELPSSVASQSEKFTSTSRTSTPCSRASRTICAGA